MQSTLNLFRHLYEHLPPLFPESIKQKMGEALESLEKEPAESVEDIENVMIKFGYEVWPWNQAFKEFLVRIEEKVGEHFLLPKLSAGLQEKYKDFKLYGGTLRDLHSGRPAAFFSSDERQELCGALVDFQKDLRTYAENELKSLEKDAYLQRVNDFLDVAENIKNNLDNLRFLADRESDHPMLSDEIRQQVRAFEHGLCLLGPNLSYDAVCQASDFYLERKKYLNQSKGIHSPAEVDFFVEK